MSFSAASNVEGDTSGPAAGEPSKVVGDPGGGAPGAAGAPCCVSPRHAATAAITP